MFKKIILLSFVFLFSIAYAFDDRLSNLEQLRYGTSYENESISERLNRLETDFFGMSQTGDINSRLDMIENISNNSKLPSLSNAYVNTKPKSTLRNFWNNITSNFDDTGSITGYTPNIFTTSKYGYPNNMYRNEFYNFLNNSNQYCPYANKYQTKNHILNRPYHNNGIVKSNADNRFFNNKNLNSAPFYNPNQLMSPPRTMVNSYYLPPNVTTKSSIHIIKD